MGTKLKILVIYSILIFGNLVQNASSIDCWVCDSDSDGSNCGESINEIGLQDSKSTASNCAACGKNFKALGTIFSYVQRTCLSTESDTCDNKIGYGSCTCSTTFCNGQNRIGYSTILMTMLAFISVFRNIL